MAHSRRERIPRPATILGLPVLAGALLAVAIAAPGRALDLGADPSGWPAGPAGARWDAPVAVSPGSATELAGSPTACPPFSWTLLPGALEYELVVLALGREAEAAPPTAPALAELAAEEDSVVLRQRVPGGANHWLPPASRCLASGSSYAWAVRARFDAGWSAWSSPLLLSAPGASLVRAPAPPPAAHGGLPPAALEQKAASGPAISADGVIESTSGGFQFPDGKVQSAAFRLTVLHGAVAANGNKILGNIAGASHSGTGAYLVDLGRPGINCSVTVTLALYDPQGLFAVPNGSASAIVYPGSEDVNVFTFSSSGTLANFPFMITAVCSPIQLTF